MNTPTKRSRVGGSDSVGRRVSLGPGLVQIAEDSSCQEGGRLNQVGATAALHPHSDTRDGLLLPPLGILSVCLVGILISSGIVSRGVSSQLWLSTDRAAATGSVGVGIPRLTIAIVTVTDCWSGVRPGVSAGVGGWW